MSKDRHSTLQILWSLVTHLDIAGAVGLFWTHTAVTSIGPKGRKSDSSWPIIELNTDVIKIKQCNHVLVTLFLNQSESMSGLSLLRGLVGGVDVRESYNFSSNCCFGRLIIV